MVPATAVGSAAGLTLGSLADLSDISRRFRWLLALMGVTMLAFGSACGGGDDESAEPEQARDLVPVESLTGKTFTSIDVKGEELVQGTKITLSFGPGALTASAGCNSIRGAVEETDGTFRLGKSAGTLLGCPEDLQAQDDWLKTVLQGGLRAYDDGGNLLLLGLGVEITLEEGTVPGGPPPVVGTTWELNSYTDSKGNVGSTNAGVRLPFLRFDGALQVEVFDGCNTGRGPAEVRDDGTIVFGLLSSSRKGCPGETGEVSRAIKNVLQDKTAYAYEGQNLVITRKGSSLTYAPG